MRTVQHVSVFARLPASIAAAAVHGAANDTAYETARDAAHEVAYDAAHDSAVDVAALVYRFASAWREAVRIMTQRMLNAILVAAAAGLLIGAGIA